MTSILPFSLRYQLGAVFVLYPVMSTKGHHAASEVDLLRGGRPLDLRHRPWTGRLPRRRHSGIKDRGIAKSHRKPCFPVVTDPPTLAKDSSGVQAVVDAGTDGRSDGQSVAGRLACLLGCQLCPKPTCGLLTSRQNRPKCPSSRSRRTTRTSRACPFVSRSGAERSRGASWEPRSHGG